jgi:LPXTG-motif cell wall-anchored protein
MLVAVLKQERTAVAYQGAVQRTFQHFYRHDMLYDHAANNCAGISLDVFKALGWNVPERGPTSRVKAVGAWFYVGAKEGSMRKGRSIYDYLSEETTRLYPAVAFDALGVDLLQLVGALPGPARPLSDYEKQLKDDVEAIVLVKIPQLPSSRVTGARPASSFDDYMARVPADQAKWQVVSVGPRPFPSALRDAGTTLPMTNPAVPLPVAALGVAGLFGGGAWWRRRRRKPGAA